MGKTVCTGSVYTAELAHEPEVVKVYGVTYTGSQQQQIGGNDLQPSWTAHDDPSKPDYINLDYKPLY